MMLGEPGTGRGLLRPFYSPSQRPPAGEHFIPVNCGAIPAELVESLLFGHVKGAFTGALRDQAGKFTLAHRGTLFLDELGGTAPGAAQVKLLRVLQDGDYRTLGGRERQQQVDVRLIAATNQDLRRAVREGRFPGRPLLPPQRRWKSSCRPSGKDGATSPSWPCSSWTASTPG